MTQSPRATIAGACLGMLAVGANGTAIMAALPTMRAELALNAGAVQWAVNAYLLTSAICIIVGGKASDRVGARTVSLAGLALFGVASAIIAIAQGPVTLLAGRALQGLAAALAVPGTLAAVGAATPPEDRASAIGAWTGFLMLGFSIGPLFGGALTDFVDWRAIFWTNVIAVAAAAALLAAGPASRITAPGTLLANFDLPGFVLTGLFMAMLIFALQGLRTIATSPLDVIMPAAGSAVALFMLKRVEPRAREPMVDFSFFANARFDRGIAIGAIAMLAILTLLLYYNLNAQNPLRLGMTSLEAGLSLLPLSAGLLAFSLQAPKIVRRLGQRKALTGAMALTIAACAVLAIAEASPLLRSLALFAFGAGIAVPYASAPRLALAALDPSKAGHGSGKINACSFLGGSIGVAAGDIAFTAGGLPAVLALIGAAALTGAAICLRLNDSD